MSSTSPTPTQHWSNSPTAPPVETRELDENIYLDLDADGHIVSLTVEHAQRTAGMDEFSYQRLPAPICT